MTLEVVPGLYCQQGVLIVERDADLKHSESTDVFFNTLAGILRNHCEMMCDFGCLANDDPEGVKDSVLDGVGENDFDF